MRAAMCRYKETLHHTHVCAAGMWRAACRCAYAIRVLAECHDMNARESASARAGREGQTCRAFARAGAQGGWASNMQEVQLTDIRHYAATERQADADEEEVIRFLGFVEEASINESGRERGINRGGRR